MQKVKWLSEEALQIAEKRKEVKSKGEKERYTHINAEFQRIARRDKKVFLSDQCKEIETKEDKVKLYQGYENTNQNGETACHTGSSLIWGSV